MPSVEENLYKAISLFAHKHGLTFEEAVECIVFATKERRET